MSQGLCRILPAVNGRTMSVYIRKLRGVIGVALIWAPLWILLFIATIGSIITVLGGGSDVGPFRMMAIIGWVGFVSGGIFALLRSFAENGRAVRNISLARAALWGIQSRKGTGDVNAD